MLNVALSGQAPPEEASGKDHVIYDDALENADIGPKESFVIRLLNPYGEHAQVWGSLDGNWIKLVSKTRGQYLQVEMMGGKEVFCIAEEKDNVLFIIGITASAAVLLLLIAFFCKYRRTNRCRI